MRLNELLEGIDYTIIAGSSDIDIKGIAYDSRQVKPGYLFVCISGLKTDGHLYVEEALKNGAGAILVEKNIDQINTATVIITSNNRKALALMASNLYGRPSHNMRVIGVTGTNGKTTTTHLIKAILEEAGMKTGLMGTLYARVDDKTMDFSHTTPEAPEVERFMETCRQSQAQYVVMEVSSHALDLCRVDHIDFNIAIFTNLTQDHLDYHNNMEEYQAAKLKLFDMISSGNNNFTVVNTDDTYARDFIQAANVPVTTYGLSDNSDIKAENVKIDLKGSKFALSFEGTNININIKLIGMFSIYNVLAAIAFGLRESISLEIIKKALEKVEGIPGRFEQVDEGQDFTVVVDYAHTPDGLENILRTGRQLTNNRLITVFGCGGDRDRGKRPLMGEVAARYSDFCVVTSDNPRSEDPEAIINDIVPGLDQVKSSRYAIISDRREAINHAVYLARPGDLVIIAGKGHETYQLVKDQVLDFDDRKVASEFLKGLGK
jgi:UDP-N-acetylmuramoyl-L-alanyl-D-glutamate--2,6-diaminopimelate ligase